MSVIPRSYVDLGPRTLAERSGRAAERLSVDRSEVGRDGELCEDPVGADCPVAGSPTLEHDLGERWSVFEAVFVLCASANADPDAAGLALSEQVDGFQGAGALRPARGWLPGAGLLGVSLSAAESAISNSHVS